MSSLAANRAELRRYQALRKFLSVLEHKSPAIVAIDLACLATFLEDSIIALGFS